MVKKQPRPKKMDLYIRTKALPSPRRINFRIRKSAQTHPQIANKYFSAREKSLAVRNPFLSWQLNVGFGQRTTTCRRFRRRLCLRCETIESENRSGIILYTRRVRAYVRKNCDIRFPLSTLELFNIDQPTEYDSRFRQSYCSPRANIYPRIVSGVIRLGRLTFKFTRLICQWRTPNRIFLGKICPKIFWKESPLEFIFSKHPVYPLVYVILCFMKHLSCKLKNSK